MCAKKVENDNKAVAKSSRKSDDSGKTLRELLDEFEQIVAWFDGENLDVEAALAQYEKGAKLAAQIREKLAREKNKIEIIRRNFANENGGNFAENDSRNGEDDSRNSRDPRNESEDDEVGGVAKNHDENSAKKSANINQNPHENIHEKSTKNSQNLREKSNKNDDLAEAE